MKKILHKTLATFFIFVSSLIGLSNSNAQTGTLTASTQNVTELTPSSAPGVTPITYTNFTVTSAPGVTPITYSAGTTYLNWSTSNSSKTMITLTKTKPTGEIIQQNGLDTKIVVNSSSAVNTAFKVAYLQKDVIHTFKLYTGQLPTTDTTLGAYLGEFIVYGYDPALGINDQIENRDNEGVTVSTDPFTNQFRIHIIDRKASTVELSVFDIGGKMISAPKIIHGDTDFMYDASTLQKGVHLLKITLDNKTQLVRKIVKI
jgi:archaellum component FlaG (FlaF/FlaG flagellin family)